jgi:hypothetical protein
MLKSSVIGDALDPAGLIDEMESLRQGTRSQYESPWTSILGDDPNSPGTAYAQVITFTHNLEEIPWMVDVMSSKESDGRTPIDANANVTITKDDTEITVQNDSGTNLYFKVRAM